MSVGESFPSWRQVVLDTTDARGLAEFYRQLLGFGYRPGDEPPGPGLDDERGRDWLGIHPASGGFPRIAFQQTGAGDDLARAGIPQQLHLDLSVTSKAELDHQHERAIGLGARLRLDRSADEEEEQLRVYADPSGHLFCIFLAPQ
jgi:glyoxalase superfamily protein